MAYLGSFQLLVTYDSVIGVFAVFRVRALDLVFPFGNTLIYLEHIDLFISGSEFRFISRPERNTAVLKAPYLLSICTPKTGLVGSYAS